MKMHLSWIILRQGGQLNLNDLTFVSKLEEKTMTNEKNCLVLTLSALALF
jgi:hypothetical protein